LGLLLRVRMLQAALKKRHSRAVSKEWIFNTDAASVRHAYSTGNGFNPMLTLE